MLARLCIVAVALIASPILAEDKPAPAGKPKLEAAKCGSVKQLHVLGDIYLAGQPSPEDFQEFKKRGVKTVLNVRTQDEMTFDEAKTLKDLGLKYHHVPIATPDSLNDETFDKLRKVLSEKQDRPLLVHCASANRVGAVWLAHRVLDDGVPYDAALTEAKTVGLKATALEAKVKDYITRQQAKQPTQSERKTAPPK
jgi:uncharacterized protein (TIGR01244 family)